VPIIRGYHYVNPGVAITDAICSRVLYML